MGLPGCALSWICLFCLAAGAGRGAQSVADKGPIRAGNDALARARELDRDGAQDILAKQFERAKASFRKAIQIDPAFPDAYENLALLSLLEGDDVSAEATAHRLLLLDPKNYNGRLVAGVAAVNQRQFVRGRDILAALLWQQDVLVAAAYSVALEESGRAAQAARLRPVLDRAAVDDRDAVLAGQIFRETQLRSEAEGWLQACIRRHGTSMNPDILYMLAGMYAEQGRGQEAALLYARVLQSNPGNVDALVELSELELAQGDRQDSLTHLYMAKTLSSKNTQSLLHLSQICVRRHMFVDARDALAQVVSAEPENREAWYQLGLVQFRIGEASIAEKDFRAALQLDPKDEWSRVGLGSVLIATGREAKAEAEFRLVLAADPLCGAAHYYLGEIERSRGEVALALAQLKRAVVDAKQDARPLTALGELQVQQHDLTEASKSFAAAIALDPTSATAHYQLALLLRSQGELQAANKHMDLFRKYHDQEKNRGIVGLVRQGQWDYAGFLPAS